MSFDSQQGDSRLFRLVLTGVLLVYGAVAVWTVVSPAPPPKQEPTDQLRIAQLLIQTEEDRLKAEEEARKKAEEEAKKKAEAEAKRLAEEAAKKKAQEEAKKKAEEEARKKAAEEAKRLAEEEARKKAEEEAKKKLDAEAQKKAEEKARKKAEEEAKRLAEEEARKKAEEEVKKKLDADAQKKAKEEAKKKAEEEAKRLAEEEARKKAEEEARKKLDAEAQKKAEEEAKRLAEEEAIRLAELKKLQAEQAALKKVEEARKQAEAERQRVLEVQRLAEARRQQAIVEDLRRKEAARVAAIEAERRRVEEEKLAAARAAAARQLARIKAAHLEMQRRQEIARQNQEAAMGAGLMDGLDEPDESLDEFLDDPDDAPLVGGSSGTLLGGSAAVERIDPASSGINADELAQIDTLLEDLGDLEGMDALLADTAPGEAASLEEIQAFLEGVAAGRIVGGEMVARAITVVESPFKILSEVGGVGSRTSEAITQIIHSHTGEIKRFYDKALVKLQGLSGTVTVRMRIAADGTVQEVTVVDSTTGYPGFDAALLQRIKKWQFPPTSGRFIEGTYPFRFAEGF